MPDVQITDVPDHAHAVLRRRAAAAHQSLQEYLLTLILDQTSGPTMEEALSAAAARATAQVSVDDVNAILREDRAGH